VAFTASDKLYADAILNFIDPTNEIFSARLYRQHCIQTEFGMAKDLRIISNRDLKDLIIIDNSASSFSFHVNNGIPILPYYDSLLDDELKHLTFYLNCLVEAQVEDVRFNNEQAFGLFRLANKPSSEEKTKLCASTELSPHQQSKEYY
jgi:CTD small phosphatase-like protein 2